MKRHRGNSSCSTAQAGRPSAGGRRVPAVLERVLRDGRWSLGHRESQSGACASRSLPAAPGLCSGAVSVLSLARLQAFQAALLQALVLRCGRAPSAPPALLARRGRHQPSARACAPCRHRGPRRGVVRRLCAVCGEWFVPRAVWRGKLALMVRNEALLHQPPTASSSGRLPASFACLQPPLMSNVRPQ